MHSASDCAGAITRKEESRKKEGAELASKCQNARVGPTATAESFQMVECVSDPYGRLIGNQMVGHPTI